MNIHEVNKHTRDGQPNGAGTHKVVACQTNESMGNANCLQPHI